MSSVEVEGRTQQVAGMQVREGSLFRMPLKD